MQSPRVDQITPDNIDLVVASMVTRQEIFEEKITELKNDFNGRLDKIDGKQAEILATLAPLRFSTCALMPWMMRNKKALAGATTLATMWLGATLWVIRLIQGHT